MIFFHQAADIRIPLHESIEIEVRTRPRAHVWLHRGKMSLRLRYRVTRAVTVIGTRGKGYGPVLYGYRIRPDGGVFGREHRIHNTRRMKTIDVAMFPVPAGTVFKDFSGLPDDEVAKHVTLDVRDLPAEQQEALMEAIVEALVPPVPEMTWADILASGKDWWTGESLEPDRQP